MNFVDWRMRLVFALVFLAAFCGSSYAEIGTNSEASTEVRLLLADGFDGLIKLIEDEEDGEVASISQAVVTISIPSSGVLALKSLEVFADWHNVVALSKDGSVIRDYIITKDKSNSLVVGNLPTVVAGEETSTWFFVGFGSEYEALKGLSPWELEDHLRMQNSRSDELRN